MKVGDPKLTVKMKNAHTKYETEFGDDSPKNEKGEPFDWREFLGYNGYGLDAGGHVYGLDEKEVNERLRENR